MINLIRHIRFIKRIRAHYPVSLSVAHRMALRCHKWIGNRYWNKQGLLTGHRNGPYGSIYPTDGRSAELRMCNDYLYGWDN